MVALLAEGGETLLVSSYLTQTFVEDRFFLGGGTDLPAKGQAQETRRQDKVQKYYKEPWWCSG